MKDFEVKENVLEKFKQDTNTVKNAPKVTESKRMSDEPKKITRVRIDKKPKKKLKSTVKKKKITKPVAEKKEVKSIYPEDYPERLKTFDKKSKKFWDQFNYTAFVGEELVLDISYLGVSTGKITISTKNNTQIGGKEVFHLHARIKTADFYSYLYELDDYCDSYVTEKDFRPLKFSLIQRQSKQDIDDLQLFDHEEMKTYAFYKRVTKEKTKKKKVEKFIPLYFQDPLSVMYFVRGLPMKEGASYDIPIVNKGTVEVLNATIEKRETIQTKIGEKKAVKIKIYTKHKGKTIEGGNMSFWYSDDDKRIFLRFEAKIKIGSVSGEIHSYKE